MKKKQINMEIKNNIKILVYILAFFLFMYLMTAIITGEIKFSSKEKEDIIPEETIQYDEILAGEIFNRPESKYYVIFYDFDKVDAQTLNLAISNYMGTKDSLKVYTVDLSNNFNKSIYDAPNKNIKTSKIVNFKVDNYTLIKVQKGVNILQVEGKTNIIDYLKK